MAVTNKGKSRKSKKLKRKMRRVKRKDKKKAPLQKQSQKIIFNQAAQPRIIGGGGSGVPASFIDALLSRQNAAPNISSSGPRPLPGVEPPLRTAQPLGNLPNPIRPTPQPQGPVTESLPGERRPEPVVASDFKEAMKQSLERRRMEEVNKQIIDDYTKRNAKLQQEIRQLRRDLETSTLSEQDRIRLELARKLEEEKQLLRGSKIFEQLKGGGRKRFVMENAPILAEHYTDLIREIYGEQQPKEPKGKEPAAHPAEESEESERTGESSSIVQPPTLQPQLESANLPPSLFPQTSTTEESRQNIEEEIKQVPKKSKSFVSRVLNYPWAEELIKLEWDPET